MTDPLSEIPDVALDIEPERVVRSYARRAAVVSFVTGLISNPLAATPLTLADELWVTRMSRHLLEEIAELEDPSLLVDEQWSKRFERAIEEELSSRHRRILPRTWFGRRADWLAQRLLKRWIAKNIPIAAGALNAAQTYRQIMDVGQLARDRLKKKVNGPQNT